jgi:hypothetical protein
MGRLAQAIGVAATLAMVLASAAMNYAFGYSLGTSERNGLILGGLAVAADLAKAVGPILIAAAWAAGAYGRALAGSGLFALTVVLGFVSALGFGAENRGGSLAGRESMAAALREADRDVTATDARLRGLGAVRPAPAIEAELRGLRGERAWETSKGCTQVTAPASRDLCRRVTGLESELATAAEVSVLERKLERLGHEVRRLRAAGAGGDADPQTGAIRQLVSWLLGEVAADSVRTALVLLLAVTVEGFSAFGLYACGVGWRANTAPLAPPAPIVAPSPPRTALAPPPPWSVMDYQLARIDFQDGASVTLAEVREDYEREAARRGVPALPPESFAAAWTTTMAELGVTRRDERWLRLRIGVVERRLGQGEV